MEFGNGMGKADQCEDNRKLGNSDQNQQKKYNLRSRKVNDIVGNSKSDDVDFKCIEINESDTNDVPENEDYVEMVQGDVNCISGHPTNKLLLLQLKLSFTNVELHLFLEASFLLNFGFYDNRSSRLGSKVRFHTTTPVPNY